jgi:hypothetical protein
VSDASTLRRVISGASIGNAVERYDFAIYGFLATSIAANFFPAGNDTAALLKTFAIFAAAFGGTTPYVVTWLTSSTGNDLAPAFYVIVAAVVSLVTVLTLRQNAARPLPAVATAEAAAR